MPVRKIRSYLESDGVNIQRDKFFFFGGGGGNGEKRRGPSTRYSLPK